MKVILIDGIDSERTRRERVELGLADQMTEFPDQEQDLSGKPKLCGY